MRTPFFQIPTYLLIASAAASLSACGGAQQQQAPVSKTGDEVRGPGDDATDQRVPELGNDLNILQQSMMSLSDGIALAEAQQGPTIEAKFELDDSGKLSLSLYPAGQAIDVDAERNKFQELAGDPTVSPFNGSLEVFQDQEHLTRSARDLTLIQLSNLTVADAAQAYADEGT